MRIKEFVIFFLAVVFIVVSGSAFSQVQPANLFSDGVVLQHNAPVPIWGWAEPGEEVKLEYREIVRTVKTDEDGKWMLHLDPMEVGEPFTLKIMGGKGDQIEINNVQVGEVWLCSGQSNMAWTVDRWPNAETVIAEADNSEIRMFSVMNSPNFNKTATDAEGQWEMSSPETVGKFSATAYCFGKSLHQELGVPIGLINASWGGTPIEAWMDKSALATLPTGKLVVKDWENRVKSYDPAEAQFAYEEAYVKWETSKKAGKSSRAPKLPTNPKDSPASAGGLYNGRIAPLIPYRIQGAIWYQGESNTALARKSFDYRNQLPLLIETWRKEWKQGDFPFYFVQLPNFESDLFWPLMRESMLETLSVPNTGMAVTIDIGEANNIHPKNKQEVGRRLALIALSEVYARDIVYSGPIYDSVKVQGNEAILSFNHTGSGLMVKGEELKGFTIAGEDGQFVPAEAEIVENVVVVKNPEVDSPAAVRYGWENNPELNLYNEEGLPASPFRTDRWDIEEKKE